MDIKMLKKCMVGDVLQARKVGEIVRGVADPEAKALVNVGYAKEVKPEAKVAASVENKDAGNAPENKSHKGK